MKTTNENESLLNELTQLEADLSNQVKEAELSRSSSHCVPTMRVSPSSSTS